MALSVALSLLFDGGNLEDSNLRFEEWSECISENVPARVGGVDLSTGMWYFCHMM